MTEWLADNWVILLVAVCYVVERGTGIGAQWKARARILSDTIERQDRLHTGAGPSAKELLPEEYGGDTLLDTLLDDGVQPKDTKRVSRLRRVGRGILSALPVITRILDRNR